MRVSGNSLLYAIYVCLLVSLLAAGLLYFAGLDAQLDTLYARRSNLYLQNQSALEFALSQSKDGLLEDEVSGISSQITFTQHGLLQSCRIQTWQGQDSIASAHLLGQPRQPAPAIYLADFSQPFAYAGQLDITGDMAVPFGQVRESYFTGIANKFRHQGQKIPSGRLLPELPAATVAALAQIKQGLAAKEAFVVSVRDSVYQHSFLEPQKSVKVNGKIPAGGFRGNWMLWSTDSIVVDANSVLEDVLLRAPVIRVEPGFKGSFQAFAAKKITVGDGCALRYPSLLCTTGSEDQSAISIGENVSVKGGILVLSNKIPLYRQAQVTTGLGFELLGDVYCSGIAMLQGKITGTVTTNGFFYEGGKGACGNCLGETSVDANAQPAGFIGFPFTATPNKRTYAVCRKLF